MGEGWHGRAPGRHWQGAQGRREKRQGERGSARGWDPAGKHAGGRRVRPAAPPHGKQAVQILEFLEEMIKAGGKPRRGVRDWIAASGRGRRRRRAKAARAGCTHHPVCCRGSCRARLAAQATEKGMRPFLAGRRIKIRYARRGVGEGPAKVAPRAGHGTEAHWDGCEFVKERKEQRRGASWS